MRKKLLALLMCATMVLGTAVTASAYTADDVTAAGKIVDQYNYFKAEFNAGKFNETTDKEIKFTTNYVDGNTSFIFNYGLKNAKDGNGNYVTEVKLDKDNKKPLTKVNNPVKEGEAVVNTTATAVSGVKTLLGSDIVVATGDTTSRANVSVKAGDVLAVQESGAVHFYYVAANDTYKNVTANGARLASNQAIHRTTAGSDYACEGDTVLTLTEYDSTVLTGTKVNGSVQDVFGVDVDGYIPLEDKATTLVKAYTTLTDNYYVMVSDATDDKIDIAEALSNGIITKDAVAVNMQFYKLDNSVVPNRNLSTTATEYGFKCLYHYTASRTDETVKVATDWLSRTNLKSATGVSVYILDEYIPTVTDFFQRLGSVYKIADVVDGKFSADYLVSGTYIFDVAAATDNAGQADADKPATDTTSSPKTGDVAPIAALAVVMMGAFGAMVVASKKRA